MCAVQVQSAAQDKKGQQPSGLVVEQVCKQAGDFKADLITPPQMSPHPPVTTLMSPLSVVPLQPLPRPPAPPHPPAHRPKWIHAHLPAHSCTLACSVFTSQAAIFIACCIPQLPALATSTYGREKQQSETPLQQVDRAQDGRGARQGVGKRQHLRQDNVLGVGLALLGDGVHEGLGGETGFCGGCQSLCHAVHVHILCKSFL